MNHTTKAATLGIATAIATVTLALFVTAAVVANMMMVPIVQTAHASCITSPKGETACSGIGGSHSCNFFPCTGSINPLSSISRSINSKAEGHESCSSGKGSTSSNFPGTIARSGQGC
jgi:hypothetical protein